MNDAPPTTLTDAAKRAAAAAAALNLRCTPEVIRDEAAAFSVAARTKAGAVVLGEGACWVVCLADAQRLVDAGYEMVPSAGPGVFDLDKPVQDSDSSSISRLSPVCWPPPGGLRSGRGLGLVVSSLGPSGGRP